MAAAASPATAAATFFFFDPVRRFPTFPAIFEASDLAFPPARSRAAAHSANIRHVQYRNAGPPFR